MKKFLDLGLQPLANSYILEKNLKMKEKKFRLKIGFNEKNYLVSILNTVSKEKMFNKDYPYKSSESKTMRNSFINLAKKIKRRFNPNFVIEIGSNDGAFIKNFKKDQVVGVEPCKNLALITKRKNFKIYPQFWNIRLAKKITKDKKADLIYSANTLSHIKNFNEIFKAIKYSLSDNGILILEDPSLLECVKKVAYDQFYCEHLYVFSTISLQKILDNFQLEIFDIENISTHGGSNRYYIKKRTNSIHRITRKVKIEVSKETKYGLKNFVTYKKFAKKVSISRSKLLGILKNLKKNKKKVIGYGATAKSCTVLNYCGVDRRLIEYFYDTTSFKINKYLPGSKIKIKKYKKLKKNDVDYVFLGAWNFKDEIFKKEKKFIKQGGKFISHIPYPKII